MKVPKLCVIIVAFVLYSCTSGYMKDQPQKNDGTAEYDNEEELVICSETDLQLVDPHAYWLMRCMMKTCEVETADVAWNWMEAMGDSIKKYNFRIGRKVTSVEMALLALKELNDIQKSIGNQIDMNISADISAVISLYETIYEYSQLMRLVDNYFDGAEENVIMHDLFYREYCLWFGIHSYMNQLMRAYTYAYFWYSSLMMDLNYTLQLWYEERICELEIEQKICGEYWTYTYQTSRRKVTSQEFDTLINYYKTLTIQAVVESLILSESDKEYYDYVSERVEENINFDMIREIINCYEATLIEWRNVRSEIEALMPEEKRESYREITEQMHGRLYENLTDLKKIV